MFSRGGARKRPLPDDAYRRPENSSWANRSVQDWRPNIVKTAWMSGRDQPPADTEMPIMHFHLIDSYGFRWPVRFVMAGGTSIWDVVNWTDQAWFDLCPDTFYVRGQVGVNMMEECWDYCDWGWEMTTSCTRCVVALPYEYLEAMDPPAWMEMHWLVQQTSRWVLMISANCRLACQVLLEDWMDGMTVVLPQTMSLVYNMYYMHADDGHMANAMMSSVPRFQTPMLSGNTTYYWRAEDYKTGFDMRKGMGIAGAQGPTGTHERFSDGGQEDNVVRIGWYERYLRDEAFEEESKVGLRLSSDVLASACFADHPIQQTSGGPFATQYGSFTESGMAIGFGIGAGYTSAHGVPSFLMGPISGHNQFGSSHSGIGGARLGGMFGWGVSPKRDKGDQIKLSDIFYYDFIDDIIREVEPQHDGYYRYLRQ